MNDTLVVRIWSYFLVLWQGRYLATAWVHYGRNGRGFSQTFILLIWLAGDQMTRIDTIQIILCFVVCIMMKWDGHSIQNGISKQIYVCACVFVYVKYGNLRLYACVIFMSACSWVLWFAYICIYLCICDGWVWMCVSICAY